MLIKICGITNLEDAKLAVEAGADAVGFVFYEKSPRYVSPESAREIAAELPDTIDKVGVFVGEPPERFAEIANRVALTAIQWHVTLDTLAARSGGSELRAVSASQSHKRYLAIPAAWFLGEGGVRADLASFTAMPPGLFNAIFLDSDTAQQPGGTGKTFDWQQAASLVADFSKSCNVVVAGGLVPGNVAEAIRILKPWGVDVSSGVESSPGKKDPERVRAFIRAVRQVGNN